MRRGPLFVLALLAIPASAAAQAPTRDHTLFYYTNAALVVHNACGNAACTPLGGAAAATAVYRFVAAPLTVVPPSLDTIAAAYALVPAAMRESEASGLKMVASNAAAPAAFSSTVVAALSRFFIERARAELVESVFRDLNTELAKPQYADLRRLLPQTAGTVRNIETLNLQAMLPMLRAAMDDDLRRLPLRLVDSTLDLWKNVRLPREAYGVAALAAIGYRVLNGASPLPQLAQLDQLTAADLPDDELRHLFVALGTVARDVANLDATGAPGWYESSSQIVNYLSSNGQALRVYASLLLTTAGIPVDADRLDAVAGMVTLGTRLKDAVSSFTVEHPPTPVDLLDIVGEMVAVSTDLAPPDERAALAPVAAIVDGLRSAAADHDYSRLVQVTLSLLAQNTTETGDRLRRLVTLAGALAASKTQDDAVNALEAWADPVGSFRDRRVANHWRVTIVGYLGAAAGTEHVRPAPGSAGGSITGRHAGVFAPLGIELSAGLGGASIGVLGSVLNLGAVVDYQYHNDASPGTAVEPLPETITLRNVVAPGLFATLGLTRNYPIALGFGVQRAPRLRRVSDANGVRDQDAVQWSAFVAVDLSLFRLARWGAR